jgi:hypothetical protein
MRFPARHPLRHGGGDPQPDIEHQAILDYLAPGWDVSLGTEVWDETRAEAYAVTLIWMMNRRAANQLTPTRMLDNLIDWERATSLRPSIDDTTRARRQRLAAKMRGYVGNAIGDLEDAAREAAGPHFVALVTADPTTTVAYWPGVNPGPPGFEWSSARATVAVHLRQLGADAAALSRVLFAVFDALDDLKPSWMTVEVGLGTGDATEFIAGVGVAGLTII